MKVKITGKSARLLDDGEIVRPGLEYDLDAGVAAKLIEAGHAVAVVDSAPEETPVAEIEPATQPPRRKK